jgi:hypothetical protein
MYDTANAGDKREDIFKECVEECNFQASATRISYNSTQVLLYIFLLIVKICLMW